MAGKTEEELLSQGVSYEAGLVRWIEPAIEKADCSAMRSSASEHGLLKLLFDRDSRRLLGVHALGEQAPQLVQLGQTMMALNATLDSLQTALFSDPVIAAPFLSAARKAVENRRLRLFSRPRLSLFCPANNQPANESAGRKSPRAETASDRVFAVTEENV